MKTNPSLRIFKVPALTLLGIAIAAVLAQPAFGATEHQLVFTEDSTGLSVTYDGTALTVVDLGGTMGTQHWQVTLPASVSFTSPGISWIEPENGMLFNNVAFSPPTGAPTAGLPVASDVTLPFATILADETGIPVGSDSTNGAAIIATFDDDGEPVPDTGSTLGLLSLALAALFGAKGIVRGDRAHRANY